MIEKLLKIQKELKVPKKRFNKFGNYHYRNTDDIVEAAKPLCAAEGLVLTLSDEMVEVGGRVYVKSTASLGDGEKSISTTGYATPTLKYWMCCINPWSRSFICSAIVVDQVALSVPRELKLR